MSNKKKSTQTNTYAWQAPPQTADINALRDMKATVNPTIPYHYAGLKESLSNSWQNPLGSATSPATREAAGRAMHNRLGMDEANATAGAYADADQQNYARQAGVAGMTAPHLVQTGGTSVQSSPFNWLGLASGGLSAFA